MLKNIRESREAREVMLSLLPTSGTLAGISIGLMSVANIKAKGTFETIVDDLFLVSGIGFLAVCYLIFFAMRRVESERIESWANVIDVVFLASLTLEVVSGFLLLYEII
jgi:nitrate reductase gamma subunit